MLIKRSILILIVFMSLFFSEITIGQSTNGQSATGQSTNGQSATGQYLDAVTFESLVLSPSIELHDLRIDLMRQEEEEQVNDSTTESEDVEYHPMGFDFGNGLFFDLNHNLSFRIDYFLDVSMDSFVIQEFNRPIVNRGLIEHIFDNERMSKRYSNKRSLHYRYHLYKTPEGYSKYYKKRSLYFIEIKENSFVYHLGRRWRQEIVRSGKNSYLVEQGRFKDEYFLKENLIELDKYYFLTMSEDRKVISFYKHGLIKDHKLYTIERDANYLYVYRKKREIMRLEISDNSISMYRYKKLYRRYDHIY